MKPRVLRVVAVVMLAASAVGAASSCSTPDGGRGSLPSASDSTAHTPAFAARSGPRPSIAQLDHGSQAGFSTCTPPACPSVTPKTLATGEPHERVPRSANPALDPDASTSPGGSLVRAPGPVSMAMPSPPGPPIVANPMPPATLASVAVVVTFAFGSAALTPAARAAIDAAAEVDGIRRIDIRGRTDNVGPAAANDALARQRAAAVARYLRTRHPRLAAADVSVDAQGGCCYAAANDTPAGRARNRRVEIAFGSDPSAP